MTAPSLSTLRRARGLFKELANHSFASDGMWVIAAQIVGKGTATLLTLLLARYLTVDDFLIFTYLMTTAVLLSTYLGAGLPLAVSKFVAEGRDERSWSTDPRIGAILVVALASSIAAIALAPIYLPWLLAEEVDVNGTAVVIAAIAISWAALAQAAMYGSGSFRAAFPAVVVATVALTVIAGAALWFASLTLLIVGNIVCIALPTFAYAWHLCRTEVLSTAHWVRWPSRTALKEVIATTLPGLGFSIIYASINWLLVRSLIEQQATPDQFNQYMIGLQWFSLVLFVPLALGQVLFPKFVQKNNSGSLALWQVAAPAALTFATVLLCAGIGTLLTPAVSWLYGAQYQFTHAFVFTILLAAALSGAVNLLGSFVMASYGMTAWLLVNIASAVTAGMLLLLVPVDTAFAAARLLCLIQLTPLAIASGLVFAFRSRIGSRSAEALPFSDSD